MPWECEEEGSLKQLLTAEKPQKAAIIIGPEGGFSRDEAGLAKNQGAKLVTLGPRILRTETAAISVMAIVMYAWGDIGGLN